MFWVFPEDSDTYRGGSKQSDSGLTSNFYDLMTLTMLSNPPEPGFFVINMEILPFTLYSVSED